MKFKSMASRLELARNTASKIIFTPPFNINFLWQKHLNFLTQLGTHLQTGNTCAKTD